MSILFFFAKRFIAGQTPSEALKAVSALQKEGFLTTLDHLGENVKDEKEAAEAARVYVDVLRELKKRQLDTNVSVKLTQLGLDIDKNLCIKNLKMIAQAARETGGFVRVDIEGSDTTSATFDIVKELKAQGYPVGGAVQSMLRRTPSDVVSLLENGITMRLCKGAYKEPVDVAYQDKREVDRQYIAIMKRLLTSGLYHGIATHDDKIIAATKAFAKERGLPADRFEFQMLMGIRRKLQKKLIQEGYKLRIYVPFGRAWLPYTLRRLRERKENIWFVLKNLFRG
jgi:proline dehydrogenase